MVTGFASGVDVNSPKEYRCQLGDLLLGRVELTTMGHSYKNTTKHRYYASTMPHRGVRIKNIVM